MTEAPNFNLDSQHSHLQQPAIGRVQVPGSLKPYEEEPEYDPYSHLTPEERSKVEQLDKAGDTLNTFGVTVENGANFAQNNVAGAAGEVSEQTSKGKFLHSSYDVVSDSRQAHPSREGASRYLQNQAVVAKESESEPYWSDTVPSSANSLQDAITGSMDSMKPTQRLLHDEAFKLKDGKIVSGWQIMSDLRQKSDAVLGQLNSRAPKELGDAFGKWSDTILKDVSTLWDGTSKKDLEDLSAKASGVKEWGSGLTGHLKEMKSMIDLLQSRVQGLRANIVEPPQDPNSSDPYRR